MTSADLERRRIIEVMKFIISTRCFKIFKFFISFCVSDALELSDEEVDQPLKKYDSRAVLVETPVQKTGPGTLTGTLQGESFLAASLVECDPEIEFCEILECDEEPQVIWNFGPLEPVESEIPVKPVIPPRPSLYREPSEKNFEIDISEEDLKAPSELITRKTDFIRLTVDWM